MKGFLISIVLVASPLYLSGCLDLGSDSSRDLNVIASFESPNRSYVATLYNSSGGGAAGWCYLYVNVRKRMEEFNPDHEVVFQTRCSVKPELKWESERKLTIDYPADAIVYARENTWRSGEGVEISYVSR